MSFVHSLHEGTNYETLIEGSRLMYDHVLRSETSCDAHSHFSVIVVSHHQHGPFCRYQDTPDTAKPRANRYSCSRKWHPLPLLSPRPRNCAWTASSIQHLASSIQHPASSIQHPAFSFTRSTLSRTFVFLPACLPVCLSFLPTCLPACLHAPPYLHSYSYVHIIFHDGTMSPETEERLQVCCHFAWLLLGCHTSFHHFPLTAASTHHP